MTDNSESYLFIKYKGASNSKNCNVDLSELGESLVGFDKLIKELFRVSRVRGEFSVQATSYRSGSIVVDLLLEVKTLFEQLPFDNPQDLIDFLSVVDGALCQQAVSFFQDLRNSSKSIYDFLSTHPVELSTLTLFISVLIGNAGKYKENKNINDEEMPVRIARELNKLIQKKHAFKLALRPIIEDKASSISISTNKDFKNPVVINHNNFQEYLGDDEKILEHFINGQFHTLDGEITSLKGTRGDSLTFNYVYKSKTYNLDLYPQEGSSTKNYINYYKEKVVIEAEVIRSSFYKKPKLKLHVIGYKQGKLFGSTNKNSNKGEKKS